MKTIVDKTQRTELLQIGSMPKDFTFPENREQGCQKALNSYRLAIADKLGLT